MPALGFGIGVGLAPRNIGVGVPNVPGGTVVTNPAISGTPVVGETLTTSSGTYTATPTSYSYQWQRGGADISDATSMFYTLVDADAAAATRGNITCQVTANFASGDPVVTLTAPTTMPRRTYPNLVIRTGRRTKANHGGVNYTAPSLKCLGIGATAPSTWVRGTATTGTNSHWATEVAGITPIPSSAGASAGLSDASYVFPVTATFPDALVEVVTLTITPVDNVQTLAPRDGFGNQSWQRAHAQTAPYPDAIEIATGSQFVNKRLNFGGTTAGTGMRPASPMILRDADLARPTVFAEVHCINSHNIVMNDLQFRYDADHVPQVANLFCSGSLDGEAGLVVNRMRVSGSREYHRSTNGNAGQVCVRFATPGTYEFNDCDFEGIRGGFSEDATAKSAGSLSIAGPVTVTIKNFRCRHFYDNVFLIGSDNADFASTWLIEDIIVASPFRAGTSVLHVDVLQQANTGNNTLVTTRRWVFAQADGDSFCQTHYTDSHYPNMNRRVVCEGLIDACRGARGVSTSFGQDSVYRAITCWKTDSGPVATSSTEPDGYTEQGPMFLASTRGTYSGTNVLDKAIFYGNNTDPYRYVGAPQFGSDPVPPGPYFTKTHAVFHNGTRSNPPINIGFVASNPKAALDALDYASMDLDQIAAAVKGILTPEAGGAYDLGGGQWIGALKGDGSWNVP